MTRSRKMPTCSFDLYATRGRHERVVLTVREVAGKDNTESAAFTFTCWHKVFLNTGLLAHPAGIKCS
ncbi:MAG: hypothetical protein ACKV1O_29920 [Saprospiraceae bacterium]